MTPPNTAMNAIPVQNIWFLLVYAWNLAAWGGRFRGSTEQMPTLLGLLASILADACEQLNRHQLGRQFIFEEQSVRGIRGQINIGRSMKSLSLGRGSTYCRYPALSVDTLRNQIIKGTLARLAVDSRLDSGCDSKPISELRQRLVLARRLMENVSARAVRANDFSLLQLGRNDQDYKLPLAICELVARLKMPTTTEGDRYLNALLDDEIRFSSLFEHFVRNFLRMKLKGHRVESERLSWFETRGSRLMPSMQTDTTVYFTSPSPRRLVIDTKYYRDALASRATYEDRFRAPHLYQMYAYLRTQTHRGDMFQSAEGLLLYPLVNRQLDEEIDVQGHLFRVATIDLCKPWQEIEQRLLDLML